MKIHTKLLEQQLDELQEHRKLFDAAHSSASGAWTSAMKSTAVIKLKAKILNDEHAIESAASAAKDKGKARGAGKFSETAASSNTNLANHLDPDEFHDAKHALKKAVAEHYRGLEMLHNYRILNITGIRKALKKFQKVTKIAAQNAYMKEKAR
ncbi:SPX domain-containing protein [Mycena filopes]|nr:SPX domain-containing protein [Mycena filopes]